ncbi:MAG: Stp1/IreP family PP2C-type Ser/Thr phosphatase [Clostridiales bacterium]|nr:Stp1/IreP family PP2C-type Ser/Thr phosphatase [Clostridiales bacterium]
MKTGVLCDTGRVRSSNQDRVFASCEPVGPLPDLMIVADGMGGHNAGEKASELTVETMLSEIREQVQCPDDVGLWLNTLAQDANRAVFEASIENPAWAGMGTTLVAASVIDGWIYGINIGDSRMYVVRADADGTWQLEQISEDHSYVGDLVRAGILTKEEARHHEKKNLITRAVGQEPEVQADIIIERTEGVQLILLCSDGLTDMLDDAEILRVLKLPGFNVQEMAENLTKKANDCGGYDNISVVMADLRGDEVQC